MTNAGDRTYVKHEDLVINLFQNSTSYLPAYYNVATWGHYDIILH